MTGPFAAAPSGSVFSLAEAQSAEFVADLLVYVKPWMGKPPPVEAVRPARCKVCDTASRPLGGPLCIVGHGVRERQLRGPLAPGKPPVEILVCVRRYLCLACVTTMTVGPSVMAPRRQYSRAAIAWAIALLGVVGLWPSEIRKRVSTWGHHRETTGWRALRRWLADAATIFPGLSVSLALSSDAAARIGALLCGPAPPSAPEARAHRAFFGGWQMA